MSRPVARELELEEAETGKRYRVEFKDCCVEGSFEAVLTAKNYVPNSPSDPTPFLDSLTFGNGVTISGTGVGLAEVTLCPDCGRGDCTGEDCYWPDEAGLR